MSQLTFTLCIYRTPANKLVKEGNNENYSILPYQLCFLIIKLHIPETIIYSFLEINYVHITVTTNVIYLHI